MIILHLNNVHMRKHGSFAVSVRIILIYTGNAQRERELSFFFIYLICEMNHCENV